MQDSLGAIQRIQTEHSHILQSITDSLVVAERLMNMAVPAAGGVPVSYAEQFKCDLIVMASHGRSGPSRWAYGSVAEKVPRASPIPVLVVEAPGCVPGI